MNASPPKRRRLVSYAAILGLSLLLGAGIGLGAALIEEFGGANAVVLRLALLSLGVLVGLALCIRWWQAADEAVREAHKWAWYWGGSSGMAVGGALVIMASLPQAAAINIPAWYSDRTDPAAYAATGAFAMLALMLVGYGVAWAWWWLGRR